ncbi:MAG: RsmB/NOP family class I SAM-dependent RNA methyltransferase [Pseudomonadota bacterium]
MTPAAHIAAAIDVLDQVFEGQAAEQALTRWARGARYAGSRDRAAVRDHVFQALRCRRSYAALGGGQDGRAVMIGALRAEGVDPVTLFTGEGHAPRGLSDGERAVPHPTLSEADSADLPDWLWRVFQTDLGADAMVQARAQRDRAPIALRVNLNMKTLSHSIDMLKNDGVIAGPVEGCETALIVSEGARKIRQTEAYLTGVIELQDVSSQSAMARVTVPQGARVLDYCAGGGGKTLALAARARQGPDHARFFAHDRTPARMADLPSRAARAGVCVTLLESDEIGRHQPFDIVLCDVPCSGSGTWRRTPNAKWRMTPSRLEEFINIQIDILQSSCDFLRPGGQLIYTTCSVLARENMAQIRRFCGANADQYVLEDDLQMPVTETGDGFFFASLIRKY